MMISSSGNKKHPANVGIHPCCLKHLSSKVRRPTDKYLVDPWGIVPVFKICGRKRPGHQEYSRDV